MAANAIETWRIAYIPPDHLLRRVFETCKTYGEAKHCLEATPIARPVIYTLIGCDPGERCVIERTEIDFTTREHSIVAANDWLEGRPTWEARVAAEVLLTRTFDEAAENSRQRCDHLAAWNGRFGARFAWVCPPVLNSQTRVAVEMCPATGTLRVIGYEQTGQDLPVPATQICELLVAA
jgi:hypothetical protein